MGRGASEGGGGARSRPVQCVGRAHADTRGSRMLGGGGMLLPGTSGHLSTVCGASARSWETEAQVYTALVGFGCLCLCLCVSVR